MKSFITYINESYEFSKIEKAIKSYMDKKYSKFYDLNKKIQWLENIAFSDSMNKDCINIFRNACQILHIDYNEVNSSDLKKIYRIIYNYSDKLYMKVLNENKSE